MAHFSRRDFLNAGAAATFLSGVGGAAVAAQTKRSATDWITLGKSNVKVTRLAFGTGTFGGRVQRQLGQEEFTRLVRHAYDRGIRFFETAESYHGMPEMLSIALKGIPRDSYK
ncbi:MAG TPA: aldo/keto reductase, partial [Bryobacteraceae bacterium]|nr:aldo/keto reductase [Bryobacteraceae bacterium]